MLVFHVFLTFTTAIKKDQPKVVDAFTVKGTLRKGRMRREVCMDVSSLGACLICAAEHALDYMFEAGEPSLHPLVTFPAHLVGVNHSLCVPFTLVVLQPFQHNQTLKT